MEGRKRETIHLSLYTVTTTMRWAAMKCFINVSLTVRGEVTIKTVSTDHNLFEEKGEPKRTEAKPLLLTRLTPYR